MAQLVKVANVKTLFMLPTNLPIVVYVGRPSHLGNPFKVVDPTDLQSSLEKYNAYLIEKLKTENAVSVTFKKLLEKAREKQLVLTCFCCPPGEAWTSEDPIRCHAQIIARELDLRLR